MASTNKLTATAVEGAKRREKPYKLFDGGGLYLLVKPNGARWWRLKYRLDGVEKLSTFARCQISESQLTSTGAL
jgi:hypothetical protein